MICKECGAYNPDHATYCKVCAANLKEETASAEEQQDLQATRTFARPSWTVPQSQKPEYKAAQKQEEPEEEEFEETEEVEEAPIEEKKPQHTPVVIPEEEPEEESEDLLEDEPEEDPKPASRPIQKKAPVKEPEYDEDEDAFDEEDDEDEEEKPAVKHAARKFSRRPPVRLEQEDEEEDEDDGYDDEEDDSYEYEPTPPKREKNGKGNGPLFWILLVSIIVVIICIVVAGFMMLRSSGNLFSCAAGNTQPIAQPAAQQETTIPTQNAEPQPQADDINVVKVEETVNDKGQACVILNIVATPHSAVTLQLPNQPDSVQTNDADNTVIYRLTVTKDTFNPNVPLTESTYEVNPVVYRTEADGSTHQLTVAPFTLTFPVLTIALEKPEANEDGVIMADKENRVAISGHVDDFDVEVTVDGKPVTVYDGGLFMADYEMTAEEPVSVAITAQKANCVSTTTEFVVSPYVFVPEKMVLSIGNSLNELRADKTGTVVIHGTTLPGATLTSVSDLPSQVVCGSVTVDADGMFNYTISMDPSFFGVSRITLNAEKEEAESGSINFLIYRSYESREAFTKGYNKTKGYKEIGKKNPLDTIVAQAGTYANGNYGFRLTAKVESVETREDGLTYVKLTLTTGETVYAVNLGEKWDPASNIGKKYNLYGNFLGMDADGTTPLFAIFFAVNK